MGESKKYVVYGMMAKCSEGTMENYISTDTGHGVVYQGQPVLNANDHQKGVNLTHFGDCNSRKIYEEAKKEIDEKYKAEEGDGFFTKLGKGIIKAHMKTAVFVQEHLMFHKCELDTPLPWIFTSKDHMIDGAPALTMESQCACRYGGIITIVPEETTEENAEKKTEEDVMEQILDAFMIAGAMASNLLEIGGEITREGAALLWENMEAGGKSIIHQFFNPQESLRGIFQAGTSLINKDVAKWFRNEDLKEMDEVISKYEDEIYSRYEEKFEEYAPIRKEQDEIKEDLKKQDLSEEDRKKKTDKLESLNEQERVIFEDIDITDYLVQMGNELNSMEAVTAHKNDLLNFFNMVYTKNPIDLKNRAYGKNGIEYSIWSRPWKKEDGGTFEQDYAGNWLYGYVGAEYFAVPEDGEILKYGAGLAQLLSDATKDSLNWEQAKLKYICSLLTGNYGDNINEGGPSDAQMIQEGVDAYRENNP